MKNKISFVIYVISALSIFLTGNRFDMSWQRINMPALTSFSSNFIILPNGVLAADDGSGVWVTQDNAATWSKTLNTYNIIRMRGTSSLFLLGGIGNVAFIYKSNSTGTTWSNIAKSTIQRPFVLDIAIKSDSDFIALATNFGGSSPYLYRTTNSGLSWLPVGPGLDIEMIAAGSNNMLYGINNSNGFYRSTDDGLTWTLSNNGTSTTSFNSIGVKGADTLFLTSSDGKFYRSTDRGLSWLSITTAFSASQVLHSLIISLTGEMYVAARQNESLSTIHMSLDEGVTWTQVDDAINWGNLIQYAVSGRNKVVAHVNGKLYTNDESFVIWTSVQDDAGDKPSTFDLYQNYPNPFNPSTSISFSLGKAGFTTLNIYNISGQKVTTLIEKEMPAGLSELTFDSAHLPSGIYFYRLESNGQMETKKMILLP